MKRRLSLLLLSFTIFSLLLTLAVFPSAFAGYKEHEKNEKKKVSVRSGNTNSYGGSNSTASVHNDNSVHINQGGNGGGGGKQDHSRNNKKNNKKNNNDKDKKVVRKDVDKKTVEHVYIQNETPEVPQIINHNENVNENVTISEPQETVRHETVVEERIIERPVQEVASYHDYTVYPVKEIAVTPETGGELFALFSLPVMGGAGVFLRRKLLFSN